MGDKWLLSASGTAKGMNSLLTAVVLPGVSCCVTTAVSNEKH